MAALPFVIPVGPRSVRVFCGYRNPALPRETFFKELGDTFMPGTPAMLAPLGLAAYLPAVLDLDTPAGLPDEVALIVYASLEAYTAARQNSIEGRMYTHSHAGVFDMARSRGQWPGPVAQPDKHPASGRWCWFAFDQPTDWQDGSARVVFLFGRPEQGTLQDALLTATQNGLAALTAAGADQAIFLVGDDHAVVWLHGAAPVRLDLAAYGFIPAGVQVGRDLEAVRTPMPTLSELVTITGPSAFSFRFVREPRFFL